MALQELAIVKEDITSIEEELRDEIEDAELDFIDMIQELRSSNLSKAEKEQRIREAREIEW